MFKLFFMWIYTFKTFRNIFKNLMRFNQKGISNNRDNSRVTATDLFYIILDIFSTTFECTVQLHLLIY